MADKSSRGAADKHDWPSVSVIIPCYNSKEFIVEALQSVLEQDYPHLEIIVVDDGSSDNTREKVSGFGDKVTLICQENQGAAVARNTGVAAARGEYISFLDSDDRWMPGKLYAQIGYLMQHPDIGVVFSRWAVWAPDSAGEYQDPADIAQAELDASEHSELVPERSGWLYNRLLFSSLMHTITVTVRADLMRQVGTFDPTLKRGQDYDYWIRLSRVSEIHQLNQVHALYRDHGEGCITKWPDENYEYMVVSNAINRWGLTGPQGEQTSQKALSRRLSDTCCAFGYYHYHHGDPRIALKAYRQALVHAPLQLHGIKYFMLSLVKTLFS